MHETSHAQTPRLRLQLQYLEPTTDTLTVTVETQGRSIPFATAYRTVRRVRHSGRAAVELTYQWRGNDGRIWPDGSYTLTATALDANNQSVAISTEVQATVDSVDLTQDPPQLTINGQNYTLDKIKRIVRPTT